MPQEYTYQDEPLDELINGETVLMHPLPGTNHSIITSNIFVLFKNYLWQKDRKIFVGKSDLYLTSKDRFLPDGMIVCGRDKIKYDGVYGAPDLVVEVLSPLTVKRDKGYKKDLYAKAGVREYWIVSPGEKSVEIYLSQDRELVFNDAHCLYPDYLLEKMTSEERAGVEKTFKCSLFDDLEISLDDIFRDLL